MTGLTLGFASDSELAVRKVEFAEHLRALDPQRLPSDAEFFRTLNQHAISSSLLAQSDAAIYRSLRDELGTAGVAQLIERLPPRHGALLFALAPGDCQDQVARVLPRERRLQIAGELLSSNRISREEREYLFAALDAARTGRPLPSVPAPAPNAITDRGREVGAADALSILLGAPRARRPAGALRAGLRAVGGALPRWFEDILHPAMLLKLPAELRGDLLLEVDIKGLAAWCSIQDPDLAADLRRFARPFAADRPAQSGQQRLRLAGRSAPPGARRPRRAGVGPQAVAGAREVLVLGAGGVVPRASACLPLVLAGWLSLGGAQAGCEKVPIVDIAARFALADSTWFAEEDTLFVFYRVEAEQGLGPASQIELAYRTDDTDLGWTPLGELSPVHTHLPVDCGIRALCGSTSLRIAQVPRQVRLRLRFHRDGQTTLEAPVAFNVVGRGPAHTQPQPARLRRLRRGQPPHRVARPPPVPQPPQRTGARAGTAPQPPGRPIRGTARSRRPSPTIPTDTLSRRPVLRRSCRWDGPPARPRCQRCSKTPTLPLAASPSPLVCAEATVTDGKGTFPAAALARKNPEVRPAFPVLRSPIRENTEVGFLLRPCARTISEPHRALQVQRLLIAGEPEICVDDVRDPTLAQRLAAQFRARLDEKRALGKDMVLTLALHHDDSSGALAEAVEQALEQVLPFERDRGSPRVSGAFVFDSVGYALRRRELQIARALVPRPGRRRRAGRRRPARLSRCCRSCPSSGSVRSASATCPSCPRGPSI